MRSTRIRVLLLALVATTAALVVHGASATVPGANGRIAFGGGDIYTVNPDGTGLIDLTAGAGTGDYAPKWSPSGGMIAYESVVAANRDIYVVRPDGSGRSAVAATPATEKLPSWSPDGKKIVYSSDGDLVVKELATGATQRLTATTADEAGATYSPDGATIAFTRTAGTSSDIYAMNADGTAVHPLTTTGHESQPDFSPDGRKILFASTRAGTSALYVMNADGSGQSPLARSSDDTYQSPSWGPNGARIVYVRTRLGLASIWTSTPNGFGELKVTTTQNAFPTPSWQASSDTTPPAITIWAPEEGAKFLPNERAYFSYSCEDDSGGMGVADCSGPSGPGGSGLLDTSTPGAHSLTVTARDFAGNTRSATRSYTVASHPIVTVASPAEGATILFGEPVPLTATCADGLGNSLYCQSLDADMWSVGSHTVRVWAYDRVGNVTSVVRNYSIVVTGPMTPRDRLVHLRDLLIDLKASPYWWETPWLSYSRLGLTRAVKSLDTALEPARWRADGTLAPTAGNLDALWSLWQVAAILRWSDVRLSYDVFDHQRAVVAALAAIAHLRYDEILASPGARAVPKFTLWRAHRRLQNGDQQFSYFDLPAAQAAHEYIGAWQTLLGY